MSRPAVFTSQTYDDALALAKVTGKLLVLDATAAWCQPCKTMDRVTWSDARVVAWLGQHAVAVQLDVDEEKAVAASLIIRAMPTVVAFREGAEFDRIVGIKGPEELIAWLEGVERGETAIDPLRRAAVAKADDMQARYSLARALLASRRFTEATDEYEWLWLHVLEHRPSMVGVRGSYMLTDMGELVRDHPPARERFTRLRDARVPGDPENADPERVEEWIDLCLVLGDRERVVTWFDAHAEGVARMCRDDHGVKVRVARLLREQERWAALGSVFAEPAVEEVRSEHGRLEATRTDELPPPMANRRAQLVAHLEDSARTKGAVLLVALAAAGRLEDARQVAAELRQLYPGDALERKILETAKTAGVDLAIVG
jgi:thiol-disulfide isomerase/thioredoxin